MNKYIYINSTPAKSVDFLEKEEGLDEMSIPERKKKKVKKK
jgi:hypothetical protein